MFAETLQRIMDQTPGAVGITLMDNDGIPIETNPPDGASGGGGGTDWFAASIEYAAVLGQLKSIAEGMGNSGLEEVTFKTGVLTTVVRPLTAEYLLALSLGPAGNHGKGRYLMRVVTPDLVKELT
jgi:predicted regulator of Ras-like GTPase activity (Roadblock/LC7/MglB family)